VIEQHACDRCLARAWLITRLSGNLDRHRSRLTGVLALEPDDLIDGVAGDQHELVRGELERFEPDAARERAERAGIEAICRHDNRYPKQLEWVPYAPSVLHVAGGLDLFLELVADEPVAIVGSRRPSGYGIEVARSLGRGLAASGLTVISGLALGIDAAAHAGALDAGGGTVAVLPRGVERAYPPAKRALYREIVATGAAVSELPPGSGARRWTFPARNRIIAGLSAMTVVVEAGERSGSLVTASVARDMRRAIGAVPGRVTSPQAAGTNELLHRGRALVVRDAQDVLDAIFGAGAQIAPPRRRRGAGVPDHLRALLDDVGNGRDTAGALAAAGTALEEALAGLAELELGGHVRREAGGRYVVVA
jgi:DNA processing protein